MCIRDRSKPASQSATSPANRGGLHQRQHWHRAQADIRQSCLLYTSDAADERSSVDLGGRRIIKKKTLVITNNEREATHIAN